MKYIYTGLCILLSFTMLSCFNDDNYYNPDDGYWIDYAAVDSLGKGAYYLTLDNGETLWPINQHIDYKPRQRERVLVSYALLSNKDNGYDYYVRVNNITKIQTKKTVVLEKDNGEMLGSTPTKMGSIWIGGGFVNMRFTYYYDSEPHHILNLARNHEKEKENQLYFEFRRNNMGDVENYTAIAHVAFDILPLVHHVKDSIEIVIENIGYKGNEVYREMHYNIDTIKQQTVK